MSNSRETILNRLRSARRPFEDAPPRPENYLPVTRIDDTSPEGLLARFQQEYKRLSGEVFVSNGDNEARAQVLSLLKWQSATRILAWDFEHIPISGLQAAIRAVGIEIMTPDTHDEFRAETLELARDAQVGLTGADAAAATTGTLIVTTGPGKGRIPTVLPPTHITVITLGQLIPRIEDWIAIQRATGLPAMRDSANFAFLSGPSRTGDIEMQLILGVHGPGRVQVVVKR
jgi:L-lactate dehydrogenase complex protein LldG